ncbi:MAG: hypothetical protein ABSE48_00630 [Verrucomicrobiota bacterium]
MKSKLKGLPSDACRPNDNSHFGSAPFVVQKNFKNRLKRDGLVFILSSFGKVEVNAELRYENFGSNGM